MRHACRLILITLTALVPGCRNVATVEVNSTPAGAAVFLDGESTGFVTPHTFTDVYAGFCRVRVSNDHSTWTDTFSLARNEVRVVNALLAQVRWQFQAGTDPQPPAVGPDGTVLLMAEGRLCALDSTGTRKWEVRCTAPYSTIASAPAVSGDGTVFVQSDDAVRAFGPDGGLRWQYDLYWGRPSCPAIGDDGTVYIATNDSLLALSPQGVRRWAWYHGEQYAADPAIAPDGTIFLASEVALHAVSPSGSARWRAMLPGYSYSSKPLALGPDTTIYVARSDQLLAFSPSGAQRWAVAPGYYGSLYGPAVGTDGVIYTGSYNCVGAQNPDGSVLWRNTAVNAQATPALSADGLVYHAGWPPVSCVTTSGVLRWTFEDTARSGAAGLALGPDGTIYCATGSGLLYALAGSAALARSSWPMYQHDAQHTGRMR
jgi:hypothetical protein